MKKLIALIGLMFISVTFFTAEKSMANSCFLASESGASENCDNGAAQTGLPKHELTTTSKKGTTGLCNNVNVFADCQQAKEYAKTHEYDYITLGNNSTKVASCPNTSPSHVSTCYIPRCTYTTRSACEGNIGKTCCKSLINEQCWHECDLCTFNKIGGDFYPYGDDKLEGCVLVGSGGMNYKSAVYTSTNTNKNYKINDFRDLEPVNNINNAIWKCNLDAQCQKHKSHGKNSNGTYEDDTEVAYDCDTVESILSNCSTLAGQTGYIKGFDEKSTAPIDYLCLNGVHHSLSISADNFVNKYGCPLSAIQCDESKGYYRDEDRCQHKDPNHNLCSVVKTYRGYGESECWHGAKNCSDFGYGDYITGNYNSLTCQDESNTEKKYYCPKGTSNCYASTAVTLNDHKCGACECKSGATRISNCNSFFYEIIHSFFTSKKVTGKTSSCDRLGYEITKPTKNSCTACPYNATYWKCD